MKLTLLEMTQSILSSMGSDQVNSISDTTESLQVADIIKQTYMNMLGRYDLPQHNQMFQLQASVDSTRPVLMTFPPGVTRIEWLKYQDTNPASGTQTDQFGAYSQHDTNVDLVNNANNNSPTNFEPVYKDVRILPLEDFIVLVNSMGPDIAGDVGSFEFSTTENATGLPMSFKFYFKNDKQPEYCCVVGNRYLIFDSFDNTQDDTLQSSKTMAFGWVYPPLVMEDNAYPPIEDQTFPLFLASAKILAFEELKQLPHKTATEEEGRQVVSLQKWKAIANKPSYFDEIPNFGRRWSGKYWNNYL